mmetsp:Transcript_18526/g.36893  ORF Transcript_18526/g.36893 Transcript_18526/m.36893 type:complete len:409 (+) Transcript_18526:1697-2923(+)
MMRSPLDHLILQVCLLEEDTNKSDGTAPIDFLERAPKPQPHTSLLYACQHLMEVGAIKLIRKSPPMLFCITPLGYHLAHLPCDCKIGKILIEGCILGCVESALTVAAILSNTKPFWLQMLPGPDGRRRARDLQTRFIEHGFGSDSWRGGAAKGDTVAAVAAYLQWKKAPPHARWKLCRTHALDHNVLSNVDGLRTQYQKFLVDASLASSPATHGDAKPGGDVFLTTCCLVAGLYPNVATLVRPGPGRFRGGRFVTRGSQELSRPTTGSFQADRLRHCAEEGADAYACFTHKLRVVGAESAGAQHSVRDGRTSQSSGETSLCDINFVPRWTVILFGGKIELRKNAVIIDGWLKFKVGDEGSKEDYAVLVKALKQELDLTFLARIGNDSSEIFEKHKRLIEIVVSLLSDI